MNSNSIKKKYDIYIFCNCNSWAQCQLATDWDLPNGEPHLKSIPIASVDAARPTQLRAPPSGSIPRKKSEHGRRRTIVSLASWPFPLPLSSCALWSLLLLNPSQVAELWTKDPAALQELPICWCQIGIAGVSGLGAGVTTGCWAPAPHPGK